MATRCNFQGTALLRDSFPPEAKSDLGTETKRPDRMVSGASDAADARLMEQVASGDHAAFEKLVRGHTPRMYALARRLRGRSVEAEEIVQEAFLRVWVHAGTWSPEKGSFAVWFARIVVNLCLDRQRKDRYEPLENEDSLAADDEEIPSGLFREQLAEHVAGAVAELPPRQRTALVLCYYEGFSNAEAAAVLGVTVGAMEALLVRARSTLRKRLAAAFPWEENADVDSKN